MQRWSGISVWKIELSQAFQIYTKKEIRFGGVYYQIHTETSSEAVYIKVYRGKNTITSGSHPQAGKLNLHFSLRVQMGTETGRHGVKPVLVRSGPQSKEVYQPEISSSNKIIKLGRVLFDSRLKAETQSSFKPRQKTELKKAVKVLLESHFQWRAFAPVMLSHRTKAAPTGS